MSRTFVIEHRLTRRRFVHLGLAGAGTALATGAWAAGAFAASDKPPVKAAPTPSVKAQTAWAEGEMVLGRADAPVTMIEYASMTCTHCAKFENETLPELKKRYIETGKVKLVFREFPLDGVAMRAAMLARCSGPERYFGVVELLFRQQEKWAAAADPVAALQRVGEIAGVSHDTFDACMADKALMDRIVQSRLDAEKKYEIESTPSFIIDGKVHSGEMTIDALAKLLDPLLARS